MNNNLELEKELNNVENVEMNNIQDVEIQNDIKDINSKVDELNVLINQKNNKKENLEFELKKENNLIQNNNQVFGNGKTIVDLKKEIFNHRKLVRWTSFFGLISSLLWIAYLISYFCFFNSEINLYYYNINLLGVSVCTKLLTLLFGGYECYSWIFLGLFVVAYLTSIILNIIMLCKLKEFRKIYIGLFILSFFIPLTTWLYCMGLMSFMKHNNKINYYDWLRDKFIKKYDKKINHCKNCK